MLVKTLISIQSQKEQKILFSKDEPHKEIV